MKTIDSTDFLPIPCLIFDVSERHQKPGKHVLKIAAAIAPGLAGAQTMAG
ncbi:hypothetical protein [Herminiimonas sp. CN]|nr:hypothetical protein [Herminiimonas sp. CN]